MSDESPHADGRADGRVLRGARSHAQIVDATYELIRGGNEAPTAEEIAARAGVGLRTVFRQFEDLEGVYRGVAERVQREAVALLGAIPPNTGVLAADLRAMAERRAKLYEHTLPFRRAGRLVRLPEFRRAQAAGVHRVLRGAVERLVAAHLAPAPREAAARALEVLDLLLSVEAWERLREAQRLSIAAAIDAVVAAALAVIAGAAGAAAAPTPASSR